MESKGRIQNSVCRSRFLLPWCVVIAVVLWCLPSDYGTKGRLLGGLVCLLTAYILMETVNSNSLIRVYTRSVTSFFVLTAGCIGCLHVWQPSTIAALCVAGSEYLIFKTDERKSPVNDSFHILLLLGVASLFVPQLVVFVPFFYCYIVSMLRTYSLRAFLAGIIGLALPAGAALGIAYLTGNLTMMDEWIGNLTDLRALHLPAMAEVTPPLALCFIALALLTLWCGLWFLSNMYRDKLRIRTIYRILYTQALVLIIVVALQPHLVVPLLPALLVIVSPIVGHYFTLSQSWLCTAAFFLTALLLIALALLTMASDAVHDLVPSMTI